MRVFCSLATLREGFSLSGIVICEFLALWRLYMGFSVSLAMIHEIFFALWVRAFGSLPILDRKSGSHDGR